MPDSNGNDKISYRRSRVYVCECVCECEWTLCLLSVNIVVVVDIFYYIFYFIHIKSSMTLSIVVFSYITTNPLTLAFFRVFGVASHSTASILDRSPECNILIFQ